MTPTLIDLLYRAPAARTAIVVPESNVAITYGQLRGQVEALACHLAAAIDSRGGRIAIALPNGLPMIVSLLAASTTATAAPLNPAYTEGEFGFALEDIGAELLIAPRDGGDAARRAAAARNIPVCPVGVDSEGRVEAPAGGRRKAVALPAPDGVALVLHTSGTTGRPKRVPLTHANLALSAENIARTYSLAADDVTMCVMPLFHVHGLVASTLATLATGGTVVMPAKFNPLSFSRLARQHRITWYSASPTVHRLILTRWGGARSPRLPAARTLRFIRSCSSALPVQLMERLERTFGAPVLEAYGMTEAAHQIATNPLPPNQRKPGSVGCADHMAVDIVDASGAHVPAGQPGEVVVRGATVIGGYEDNPAANSSSFVHGWFRTGDQGYLDADGYLHLVARIKELINRGGEKISPLEIDDVLLGHPAVDAAACFGVPHDIWGEEVEAAVELRDGAHTSTTDLLKYCTERLADYKRPKQIHIMDSIPRTATGKIQRREVAEKLLARVS